MPSLPRSSWPYVLAEIVDDCIAAAKRHGVRGKLVVSRRENGDYVVALVIPAAETVPARAWSSGKPPEGEPGGGSPPTSGS